MSETLSNAEITQALWNAVNKEGPEAMRRWLAPNYVRHGSDRDYTRDEWIDIMVERSLAFPDNQSSILDIISDGDKVSYRWVAEGTHKESYLRIPATGRKVVAQGITISRFEGGLIHEEWASWNKTSVLHALGILPIT